MTAALALWWKAAARLCWLAPLLALTGLSGCTTLLTTQSCHRALTGLTAASDIAAALRASGIQPGIAAKIGSALAVGQITLATACGGAGL